MERGDDEAYPLVDTHAHLTWKSFTDVAEVVARARASGVERVLSAATDLASAERAIDLAASFPEVYVAVGIHPNDLHGEVDVARIRELAGAAKVAAIGETGLDYYRHHTSPEAQRRAFAQHLELAVQLDLPVVIHNREADRDILAAVRACPGVRGVLHCFTGDAQVAEEGLDLGLFISFAGNLTYPTAGALRGVAGRLPIDRLLVETDAPFLAPVPHRGRRNEPAYVRETLQALAACHGLPAGQMARQVATNARALFRW
jgi:TatD DNase family protein